MSSDIIGRRWRTSENGVGTDAAPGRCVGESGGDDLRVLAPRARRSSRASSVELRVRDLRLVLTEVALVVVADRARAAPPRARRSPWGPPWRRAYRRRATTRPPACGRGRSPGDSGLGARPHVTDGSVGFDDAEVAAVELDDPVGLVHDVVVVVAEQDQGADLGVARRWSTRSCDAPGTSPVAGCIPGTGSPGRGRRPRGASARAGPAWRDRRRGHGVGSGDDPADRAVTQRSLDVLGVDRPGELAIEPPELAFGQGRPVHDDRDLGRGAVVVGEMRDRHFRHPHQRAGVALRRRSRVVVRGRVDVRVRAR